MASSTSYEKDSFYFEKEEFQLYKSIVKRLCFVEHNIQLKKNLETMVNERDMILSQIAQFNEKARRFIQLSLIFKKYFEKNILLKHLMYGCLALVSTGYITRAEIAGEYAYQQTQCKGVLPNIFMVILSVYFYRMRCYSSRQRCRIRGDTTPCTTPDCHYLHNVRFVCKKIVDNVCNKRSCTNHHLCMLCDVFPVLSGGCKGVTLSDESDELLELRCNRLKTIYEAFFNSSCSPWNSFPCFGPMLTIVPSVNYFFNIFLPFFTKRSDFFNFMKTDYTFPPHVTDQGSTLFRPFQIDNIIDFPFMKKSKKSHLASPTKKEEISLVFEKILF